MPEGTCFVDQTAAGIVVAVVVLRQSFVGGLQNFVVGERHTPVAGEHRKVAVVVVHTAAAAAGEGMAADIGQEMIVGTCAGQVVLEHQGMHY